MPTESTAYANILAQITPDVFASLDRDAAIALLVECDCAKWGESERDASKRMHADRSLGLALNELANRVLFFDPPADRYTSEEGEARYAELTKIVKKSLTAADRRALRTGG